jgi:hypothetical protein
MKFLTHHTVFSHNYQEPETVRFFHIPPHAVKPRLSETQSAFVPGGWSPRTPPSHSIASTKSRKAVIRETHITLTSSISPKHIVAWFGDFWRKLCLNSGSARWTDLVMTSLHSVRFCLRLNNHTHEPFVPSRGLRQGDPLIPYLFLFVGEALFWFFRKQIVEGCITPIKALFGTRGFVGISGDNPLEYWVKSLPSPNPHKTPPTIH